MSATSCSPPPPAPAAEVDIEERESEGSGEAEAERVYVALGGEVKEGRANLLWVLQNTDRNKKIVIAHVHRPAARINIMGAWFPVSQLEEQEVIAYRLLEREKIYKTLKEYLDICSSQRVEAEKVVIQRDDTARGIVDLINENGVTELVMGAAADRRYSRRMRAPRSKKAIFVQQKADQSCKISFVCRGNLICTREAGEGSIRADSSTSTTSPSPRSSISEPQTGSVHLTSIDDAAGEATVANEEECTDGATGVPMEGGEEYDKAGPSSVSKDAKLLLNEAEEGCTDQACSSSRDGSDDISIDIDLYEQLKDALTEAEDLKNEVYEETRRRQQAERYLAEASKQARIAENLHMKEVRQRKDVEEKLARENLEIEQDQQQLNQILNQINKANEQRLQLELRITDSESTIKQFEEKLSEAYRVLESLRLDQALNAHPNESYVHGTHLKVTFPDFSCQELELATNGFDESLRIGECGHGFVYKGFVKGTEVAIKMLNRKCFQGEFEFAREVEDISKARHPNLITLIGASTESHALIYEYLPNGTLEDRLRGKNCTLVLTWQARARIASEICSALTFLHSDERNPIIHGNLKPNNILFDSNHSIKLSDFHIGTNFHRSYTYKRSMLAYVEPESLATGELTPQSDMYSFGVILLVLLTGRPAFRIKKVVQEVLNRGGLYLREVLDVSAGDWPLQETRELALIALKCCDLRRDARPSIEEVFKVVQALLGAVKSCELDSCWSFGSDSGPQFCVPSYFVCPILKEMMKDPQIAADGFTYEAEAIKEWFDNGHDTSPMTNLKLPSSELIPNHALRSAIQEWLQKRG